MKPRRGRLRRAASRARTRTSCSLVALAMPAYYGWSRISTSRQPISLVMPIAFAIVFVVMGILLRTIEGAAKDKSIVIFVVFVFVVLFWMAFEQAGNALNLWAEFFTDRHIGSRRRTRPSRSSRRTRSSSCSSRRVFSAAWLWLAQAREGAAHAGEDPHRDGLHGGFVRGDGRRRRARERASSHASTNRSRCRAPR